MLEDWHYETSSSSESTGSSLASSLEEYTASSWYGWGDITIASAGHDRKLVVFNKNIRIASRQSWRATLLRHHPREPCTPMKMADAGSSKLSFYRPLERQKKSNFRKRIFFRGKNLLRNLKEHFGQYFLINSGVIVIEVVCSFNHPILLFLLLCRYLQDNKIQKLEKGAFSGLNLLQLL